MTIHACVLAKARPGEALAVVEQLKHYEFVGFAAAVTGPDDILIIIQSPDANGLGDILVNKIQTLAIVEARTLVIVGDNAMAQNWLAKSS